MTTAAEYRRGRRRIQMYAIVYSPDANGGPGKAKLDLTGSMLNCAWQKTMNLPSQAAFTIPRSSKHLPSLGYQQDHIILWREQNDVVTPVFQGKIVKPSEAGSDVIVFCLDYLSYLQRSRTGFRTLYPTKAIGTEIVSPEWTLARTVADSPLAFVATGTIQDPLGADNVTVIKTNAKFGLIDFDRLFTFFSLSEMAMANTPHVVKFEITNGESGNTFNFWKDNSTDRSSFPLHFPGNLAEIQYDPGYDQLVNDLATAIKKSGGGTEEYVLTDAPSIAAYRRLQGSATIQTLLGINTGTTETDQQKAAAARLLAESTRVARSLILYPRQSELPLLAGWDVGDNIPVVLQQPGSQADELNQYMRITSVAASWSAPGGERAILYAREKD